MRISYWAIWRWDYRSRLWRYPRSVRCPIRWRRRDCWRWWYPCCPLLHFLLLGPRITSLSLGRSAPSTILVTLVSFMLHACLASCSANSRRLSPRRTRSRSSLVESHQIITPSISSFLALLRKGRLLVAFRHEVPSIFDVQDIQLEMIPPRSTMPIVR
jgi:hypothetical protein